MEQFNYVLLTAARGTEIIKRNYLTFFYMSAIGFDSDADGSPCEGK